MSEQDKQGDAEHNDSQSPDSLADSTSTTTEAEVKDSDFDGEESKSNLSVDKDFADNKDTGSVAKEQSQKQIEAYERRLSEGEIERDDIPKWVLKHIDFKDDEPNIDAKIDAKVAEKLSSKEDAKKYESLKDKLKNAKVTQEQYDRCLNRFNGLKTKFGRGEALEIAIEAAGINFKTSGTKARPSSMNPPATPTKESGGKISKDMTWKEVQKNYSEEDRRKALIAEVNG